MPPSPVLIVGAGPSGLNLALALVRRNVQCRLISEAAGPGEESRAMVVQARTLEFYGQYGFAKEVIEQGVVAETAHVREGGQSGSREVLSISFKEMGAGLSPYPFALAYPQDDHERFLIAKLKDAGCEVEWGAKLTGFSEDENGVRATIEYRGGGVEQAESTYICGCDGARSCVRETLGLRFPGGTYEQLFYVADVEIASGFSRDLYINLGEHILTLMFPVRSSGMQRLIGLVPPELSHRENLGFEDIRAQVEPLLDIKVTKVNWFSTYRVHHRVADKFRVGRAFLVGDAGHIHSPAGGQGMNTGIGDAVNLGWKIAHVVQNRADTSLLDTYEPSESALRVRLYPRRIAPLRAWSGKERRARLREKLSRLSCSASSHASVWAAMPSSARFPKRAFTIPIVSLAGASPAMSTEETAFRGQALMPRIISSLCVLWTGRHMCTVRQTRI
jgi:2-polyprenyl-6-methoxyphenol hydroxylase-like FAD-dependent oxidoreductase